MKRPLPAAVTRAALPLLLLALAAGAGAAEAPGLIGELNVLPRAPAFSLGVNGAPHRVRVCWNWGCKSEGELLLDAGDGAELDRIFRHPSCRGGGPGLELQQIRLAIRYLERRAGEQLPVANDRGGNEADAGVEGRTDCIDNTSNTLNYLHFLDRLGYLHHWRPPASGYYESTCLLCPTPRHTAAVLVLADRPAVRFVVDTWLRDNGSLPLVAPEGPWRRLFIYRDNDRLNPWFGLEELQVYCDSGFFGPDKLAAAERAVTEAAAER